jgi:hypothetical protein
MNILKPFNLALAFFLELCLLTAFVYWGFHLPANIFFQIIAGIGVPLVVVISWGIWLAPNADLRLGLGWLVLLKTILFGLASIALILSAQPQFGIALLMVYAVSEMFGLMWGQEKRH